VGKEYAPNWLAALLRRPDFLPLTLSRWQQKRTALATFINESVDTFARRLAAPQHRNFQRWPILEPLISYHTFWSHDDEVGFERFSASAAWLDGRMRILRPSMRCAQRFHPARSRLAFLALPRPSSGAIHHGANAVSTFTVQGHIS
jgi:hypothetical protein